MTRPLFAIFAGSLLLTSAALATTYVRVEKDGTKTYSDRPLPGGQAIDIQPAQTYSAPATPPADTGRPREEQLLTAAANFRYECAMSPRFDETFQNPETVTLSVSLTPGLRSGDLVSFTLDGAEVKGEPSATSVSLSYPDRGTHNAGVRITDSYGKALCNATTTFHVLRTGLNSPGRQTAPRPRPPRPTPH